MLAAVKRRARWLRATLGLSPMKKLLRGLGARGVELRRLEALEVFGGTGELHTKGWT